MVILVVIAGVAGVVSLVRGRLKTLGVFQPAAVGVSSCTQTKPALVGNRGWLLLYMIGLAAQLAHGLALTIGSLVVYASPSLAGLQSFIPLWALLIYVVSNLGLLAYGVVLFHLMLSKRTAAIANTVVFNALSVAFLVTWFLLGAKSPIGTVVDSLPGISAIAYFSRSQRVRNTYVARATARDASTRRPVRR